MSEDQRQWTLIDTKMQMDILSKFVRLCEPSRCGCANGSNCSAIPYNLPLQCWDGHDSLPPNILLQLICCWYCDGDLLSSALSVLDSTSGTGFTSLLLPALTKAVALRNVGAV